MKFHKWEITEAGEWYTDFRCTRCGEEVSKSDDSVQPFPFADGCSRSQGTDYNTNGGAYPVRGKP